MSDTYYISYKNILRISLPVMVGSFANNIINVVDTALLSRVSQVALGASAIGGIFYFIMIMAGGGFNTGMQIMIARRVGEKNNEAVGRIFDNQLYQIIAISFD
jgi:Na+-driven multidrug efflux pump